MSYESNIQADIKACLDIVYSTYEDMYGKNNQLMKSKQHFF